MFESHKKLKSDAFGSIEKGLFRFEDGETIPAIRRYYTKTIWIRPLALFLAKNEKRALKRLANYQERHYFPVILHEDKFSHVRSFVEGDSMHHAVERLSPSYFEEAKKLLKVLRKSGVANNDLAKEANWLITPDGKPFISDFQLAACFKKNSHRILLGLAREDLRHLLKHKRKYHQVNRQEKKLLAKRSPINELWMRTGKKAYLFITRTLLGWEERHSPEERDF